ncbi:MAG: hypothetical protein K8S27_02895 [Candidatus Omnitrophica bacterium]|nr:hypothetical protein [Candidatus Omnitrophota bacterium]
MIKKFSGSHDKFIDPMKDNQPIAFIAMFTLVIATFSFDQNPNAKSYAIGAAFLFLTVFIYSIIISLLPNNRIYLRSILLFQMYIFFIVGISLLFYVMTDYFVVMPDVLKVYSVYPINFMHILFGLIIIQLSEKLSLFLIINNKKNINKYECFFIDILRKFYKSLAFLSGIFVIVISLQGIAKQEIFYKLLANNDEVLINLMISIFVSTIYFIIPKKFLLRIYIQKFSKLFKSL